MSEVTQQLAHVGPCVPAPGSDCTPESGGTDCWRSYFNLEPCLSEPFSETQVMPMLCTSIVSNFYPHCVVQWYWRKVGLMLRCSSLGMTENCDSWPPNSHQANMDNRNNPEHLQSSFIWRAHNFWTAEMSITPLQPALLLLQGRAQKQGLGTSQPSSGSIFSNVHKFPRV